MSRVDSSASYPGSEWVDCHQKIDSGIGELLRHLWLLGAGLCLDGNRNVVVAELVQKPQLELLGQPLLVVLRLWHSVAVAAADRAAFVVLADRELQSRTQHVCQCLRD